VRALFIKSKVTMFEHSGSWTAAHHLKIWKPAGLPLLDVAPGATQRDLKSNRMHANNVPREAKYKWISMCCRSSNDQCKTKRLLETPCHTAPKNPSRKTYTKEVPRETHFTWSGSSRRLRKDTCQTIFAGNLQPNVCKFWPISVTSQLYLANSLDHLANSLDQDHDSRALTRPTAWKVWSINLPINAVVFTAYLKSGGIETKAIA